MIILFIWNRITSKGVILQNISLLGFGIEEQMGGFISWNWKSRESLK